MKVLITGATGFIGRRVVKALQNAGDEVVVLTRSAYHAKSALGEKCNYFVWDHTTSTLPPEEAFEGVDGVINLMGEGIADKRWSDLQKRRIYDSRILGTSNLVKRIENMEPRRRPQVLVSASAIGIYGDRGEEEISEDSTPAHDFLAKVCTDWEAEANKAQKLGLRVVLVRTGVVIGHAGGALKKMLPAFKIGAGGVVGDGHQYMSWIHVDDLADMYVTSLKNAEVRGAINGTAPNPVTNKEFTKTLGRTLKRPTIAAVPGFILKLIFGEMSTVLLEGAKVIPRKIKEKNFNFKYPTLDRALDQAV